MIERFFQRWPALGNLISFGIVAACLAALFAQIVLVATNWRFYFYDFRAFYIGPINFREGRNPYDVANHLDVAERLGLASHDLSWVFPPLLLEFFAPLSWLSYPAAFGLWFCMLVAAVVATFFLTRIIFRLPAAWVVLIGTFGFNAAIPLVLRGGQLSLFSAVLLLCALGLLRRRADLGAATLIALAAVPKAWILPLLSVVASRLNPRSIVFALAAAAAIAAVHLLGAHFRPELHAYYSDFAKYISSTDRPAGSGYDASVNNLLANLANLGVIPDTLRKPALAGWTLLVLLVSAIVSIRVRRAFPAGNGEAINAVFCIAVLGLCLISPRMNIYQFTIALPALASVLWKMQENWPKYLLTIYALTPTFYLNRLIPGMEDRLPALAIHWIPWNFSSTFVAALAWAVAIRQGLDLVRRASGPECTGDQVRTKPEHT